MKAILVIDMPKSCKECRFCGIGGANLEQYVCSLTGEHSENPHLIGCPLRPLPRKICFNKCGYPYDSGFYTGWNTCIDEITGETE